MLLSISTVHSFLLLSSSALWASLVAQIVKNLPAMQETGVQSLGREDLLEKGMAIHSSILAWRIPWTEEPGRLYSPWGHKKSDVTKQLSPFFIYAMLILIYSERYELKLIFSRIEIQLFQLFVEKIILSPLNCLCHLIKKQLIKWVWV